MEFVYYPKGVCSREYKFDLQDDIIKDIEIVGGCGGNLLGIRALILNQKATDVIDKLSGVPCGQKSTSCPDQISKALTIYLSQKEE